MKFSLAVSKSSKILGQKSMYKKENTVIPKIENLRLWLKPSVDLWSEFSELSVSKEVLDLGVDALHTNKTFDQVPRGHEVLMKECIEIYQEFFVTFLSAKAFTGKDSVFDPNGWLSKMVKR